VYTAAFVPDEGGLGNKNRPEMEKLTQEKITHLRDAPCTVSPSYCECYMDET
jgi:hypothetical protein